MKVATENLLEKVVKSVRYIICQAELISYTPEQIDQVIVRAHRKRLIETPLAKQNSDDAIVCRMMRATSVGLYHVDRLLSRFEYIEAMCEVTSILDTQTRDVIVDAQTIAERFARGKSFQNYLDRQWAATGFNQLSFHWPSVSAELTKHIELAEERSKRPGSNFRDGPL